MVRILAGIALALTASVLPAAAQQVGEVGVDWLGNDILIEAVKDPSVEGVTCHVSYFDRGVVDRLQKGNWFEDPSDSAISCQQTFSPRRRGNGCLTSRAFSRRWKRA